MKMNSKKITNTPKKIALVGKSIKKQKKSQADFEALPGYKLLMRKMIRRNRAQNSGSFSTEKEHVKEKPIFSNFHYETDATNLTDEEASTCHESVNMIFPESGQVESPEWENPISLSVRIDESSEVICGSAKLASRRGRKRKTPFTSKKIHESMKAKNIIFDETSGDLLFHVEPNSQDKNSTTLSRRELLQKNPQLLLEFYENYMKFDMHPEFTGSKLVTF